MKKILIGIHGLGNKPLKNILEDWWVQSIQEGLNRIGKPRKAIPFELIYWADISHPVPLDHTSTNPDDPLFIEDPYVKGLIKVNHRKESLKAKLYRYIDEQLNKVFLNDDLSINFKHVADKVIHRYFSDLERYFSDNCVSVNNPECSTKTDIRTRFLQVLKRYDGYKILLIAHSMGSIVAFDVLYESSDQLDIDTFITIGSPLGLPVIVGKIFTEQKLSHPAIAKPRIPNCIWPDWFNMADPEDKIAMDITLNDDYDKNRLGTSAVDLTVYNDYKVNGKRNPHKAYGYLRTPELAGIVDAFLSKKKRIRQFRHFHKFTRVVQAKFLGYLHKHSKAARHGMRLK